MRDQENVADEANKNPIAQVVQLLKRWLCDVWSGVVVEKNWALTVDQCWLQFSVHLIDLLSIFLRYNGFTRIQKAVVDQMGSRPPNGDDDLFGCKFGFGKCFGASCWSNHLAGHLWLSYTICFLSHVPIQKCFVVVV